MARMLDAMHSLLRAEIPPPPVAERLGLRLGPFGDGEARVDYRDVLPTYQERATKAMQDRYIPLGMKDLVRDYFSSLGGK